MFIDVGDAVVVVKGYQAGAIGIVEKIRLENLTAGALVFVTVVPQPDRPDKGLMVFSPDQIKRHICINSIAAEQLKLRALDQVIYYEPAETA